MEPESDTLISRKEFLDDNNFLKYILYSSTYVIRDSEFEKRGLKNKNLMFFLNAINESISSISMLGCRNLCSSLLGKMKNLFDYNDNLKKQFEDKDRTISKSKTDYVRDAIKNNKFLSDESQKAYSSFFNENDLDKKIQNFKLIYKSIIDNHYFETISDSLLENISDIQVSLDKYDVIYELTEEYIALLIDYVGISVHEIRKIIKNAYGKFLKTGNEEAFFELFSNFAETYKKNNLYYLYIKTDNEFDRKLLKKLEYSNSNEFMMLSKAGLLKKITKSLKIDNTKVLNNIVDKIESTTDNNYYIATKLEAKDTWQAIKEFKERTIQPFIGTMIYSGKPVITSGEYIVVEKKNNKLYISENQFFDDIFKPLSQDFPNYQDVFKRYIIASEENEINKLIDEAVQLLPNYKNSSTLTKFTNTWFALETLFRNSGDNISNSLQDYAANLVADRMLSGYIYVTSVQIKKTYVNFKKYKSSKVENYIENFRRMRKKDCCYLEWKLSNIDSKIRNYSSEFDKNLSEAKELLSNAYYLRNKQFHGTKDGQMENVVGFIYDIVNDAIAFYIDFLDVYRGEKKLSMLFNYIRNIKTIKSTIIDNKKIDISERIMAAYDSVRKL